MRLWILGGQILELLSLSQIPYREPQTKGNLIRMVQLVHLKLKWSESQVEEKLFTAGFWIILKLTNVVFVPSMTDSLTRLDE